MDAVEDVKQRLSIEEVIGEYVELKRAGRNWKGLSPFTSERSPSFMVSPEKQIWHDFSSSKGGSMFDFVMEMEGVDFRGALEILARKAGVDLDQYRSGQSGSRGKEKERLFELLDWATKFYQTQLKSHRPALEYVLQKRGFSKETVLQWRIGYSPNTGTALVDFLKSKTFTEGQIKAAGLSSQRYRGRLNDMFRGRIMIPLADPQGRIIGFTARLLQDEPGAPKYINTPQTQLYDKSRHVFGLHLAKETMRKSKFVVVAEGNLDVISSHQAGVKQVVATAGTALTEAHLKALSRFTGDIRLSFDADTAGLSATERAIPLASKANVSLSIITIPSGKDPDELIRQDAAAWQQIIQKPQYALDWLIGRYQSRLDITSGPGKREFSDVILAVIRGLADSVEQDHYLMYLSRLLGISHEALATKLRQGKQRVAPKLKQPAKALTVPSKALSEYLKTQNHLLSLALKQSKLRNVLTPLSADMLIGDDAKALYAFLRDHADFDGNPADAAALQPWGDYVKILLLQYEELYDAVEPPELRYEAIRLQTKLVDRYVKMQKQRLIGQLQSADETQTTHLLEKVKQLDHLLKTYKGDS